MSNTDRSGTPKMMELHRPVSALRAVFAGCLLLLVTAPAWAQVSYSRTEVIAYQDNPSKWVMGQTASVTCAASVPASTICDGNDVVASATFDPNWSLPLTYSSFGKLVQTLTYHADGTVATVKDGNNNVTTLTDWYRGIPRNIQYADGAVEIAGTNPQGWITSVTNPVGSKTCYGYDAMGRVNLITQPSETTAGLCDTSAWNTTALSFVRVDATEYGIPAGHWRQTITTGNGQKITYFDGLWRASVTKELDATSGASEALTTRFQRFTYDHEGRVTFASYPGTTDALTTGNWTSYDALGRVKVASQDSELGVLTTTTAYASGFQTHVTNPRNYTTITQYQTYDQPSYDNPTGVTQSAGVDTAATEIHRDVFGKPQRIRKRNADGSLFVDRHYVYAWDQSLCKSIEPEAGATVFYNDAAGNLWWSATGLSLPATDDCNFAQAESSGRKVTRSYDTRNRLHQLLFPDGKGDQLWTYTLDGLTASVTTSNSGPADQVVNNYSYNKRRLLVSETQVRPWPAYGLLYSYDRQGNLGGMTYPNGQSVDFAPNALGQATKAGSFASGATYYPNGALKGFTYGNGIVHSMTQNARQLPLVSADSGGTHRLQYSYDGNGNVDNIYDLDTPSKNRYLFYDGLDRLTAAGSATFGGSDHYHRFTYNALDNMTSWKHAGVKDYAAYVYDASNRLANIKNTGGATIVGFGYDVQGNLNNKNGVPYDFDFGNRLRTAAGAEAHKYDAHGRRIESWMPSGGILSVYGQSGVLYFQENHRVAGVQKDMHVYLAGSLVATQEQNVTSGTIVTKYQHTDALGSPVAVTNQAGTVIERNDYEPYGAIIGKPTYQGIGYTGHVQDGATGLTYMQQRYYDPQVGLFLSVDPVTAYSNGDMRLLHRYAYAFGNPYRFSDPDGRLTVPWEEIGKVAAKGGARAGTAAIADGPEPFIGDVIGVGILIYTVGEIGYEIYQANQQPTPEEAVKGGVDGIREGKSPVAGTAGERGELQGDAGAGDADWEALNNIPGAKANGPNNINLPDGSTANRHKSTRPYTDGPPAGTDTIKHYPKGSNIPTTTIRYPERN